MFPTRDRPNVGGVTSIKIKKMEVDMGEISVNNSKFFLSLCIQGLLLSGAHLVSDAQQSHRWQNPSWKRQR